MVGRVLAVSLSLVIGATTMSQRVGRTYSNGNCAIDSNNRLTGKCVAFASAPSMCVERKPDPRSPMCKVGALSQHTRTPPCDPHEPSVSYDYTCFFVTP